MECKCVYNANSKRKRNPYNVSYSWSKIDDYDDYLKRQKKLREALEPEGLSLLRWEFDEWLKTKKRRKGKGTIRC